MKTLVSFSVGIDSTYLLWKILTETNDEVTAVYMNGSSISKDIITDKTEVKLHMAQHVVDKLQKIRKFNFIVHDLQEQQVLDQYNHKALIFIIYASQYLNTGVYDRITHGGSYDDKHQRIVPHLEYTPTYYAERRLFEKLCKRGNLWLPLITDEWHEKYNRVYAMINLPKDILREINSCNYVTKVETKNGIQFKKCNVCYKCLMNRKYISLYRSGLSPKEITEWREERSYHYGRNGIMASYKNWIEVELGLKKADRTLLDEEHFTIKGVKNEGIWKDLLQR